MDLLQFVVGVCLGLLALGAPPNHGRGRRWPLPKVGRVPDVLASTGNSSTRAGDGALISSPAPPLRGGVVAALSSLVGTAASIPSRVGVPCSNFFNSWGASWLCSRLLWGSLASDGRLRWPRAQSRARVNIRGGAAKFHQSVTYWNSNFMKNIAIFSLYLQIGAPVRHREDPLPGTSSRRSCFCLAWARLVTEPPKL